MLPAKQIGVVHEDVCGDLKEKCKRVMGDRKHGAQAGKRALALTLPAVIEILSCDLVYGL